MSDDIDEDVRAMQWRAYSRRLARVWVAAFAGSVLTTVSGLALADITGWWWGPVLLTGGGGLAVALWCIYTVFELADATTTLDTALATALGLNRKPPRWWTP